jgi:Ca-activated chloride channel family protein
MVSVDGRQLPLTAVELKAEAQGGIARVTLTQHFVNPHSEPLHVSYLVPLPEDGAVAGYAFRIGERRTVGVVDRLQAARERFARAVASGHTAALLTQQRTSVFSQELGNVPPGQRVSVELTVDQRLRWLSEGLWEWRFPTVIAPRYPGASGEKALPVTVADGPTGIHATLELSIGDALTEGRRPESPSHPVRFAALAARTVARLDEGVPLDRDVVVRWPVATPQPGVHLHRARPSGRLEASAYGLLTLVPPSVAQARLSRDLVFVLDVSGSMGGPPLAHAQRIVAALIDTLEERDTLELVAFNDSPLRWRDGPRPADAITRREAVDWVMGLEAGGSTEMESGIREALRPLHPHSQRQVVLVTDGHIDFEEDLVQELIERLPPGTRMHTVGVGEAVNRSLTHAAARAGRGVEVLTGMGEDVDRCTARLIAATRAPVLVDVTVEGEAVEDVAPATVTDLMAGAPVLLSLKLRPDGGRLVVKGSTPAGAWERTLIVPPTGTGEGNPALATLYAREKVEDLEMQRAGSNPAPEQPPRIEALGLEYQIATPFTAWVAASEEPTVDGSAPFRHEVVPQALPHGVPGAVSRPLIQVRRVMPPRTSGSASPPGDLRQPGQVPDFLGRQRGRAEEPPVPLRGRRLPLADGLATVEIQCTTLLWNPEASFEAELDDGAIVTLQVDTAASTQRTRVSRGAWVRLRFRPPPGKVLRLWWSFDGVTYVVTL